MSCTWTRKEQQATPFFYPPLSLSPLSSLSLSPPLLHFHIFFRSPSLRGVGGGGVGGGGGGEKKTFFFAAVAAACWGK